MGLEEKVVQVGSVQWWGGVRDPFLTSKQTTSSISLPETLVPFVLVYFTELR